MDLGLILVGEWRFWKPCKKTKKKKKKVTKSKLVRFVAQLCLSLWNPSGSSVHGNSPGKNTGVGCNSLLQGLFPIQGLNLGLLHCRQILYHLSHQGSKTSHNIRRVNSSWKCITCTRQPKYMKQTKGRHRQQYIYSRRLWYPVLSSGWDLQFISEFASLKGNVTEYLLK